MPKDICFVISPICKTGSDTRSRADDVFEGIIKPALEPLGYQSLRADHMMSPGKITDQVIDTITTAPMVIADLTDLNANVFYELSLRHVSEKPVVHIIHKDQQDQIPFDVQAFRTVAYSLEGAEMIRAQENVRNHVKEAEDALATKNLLLDKIRRKGKGVKSVVESLAEYGPQPDTDLIFAGPEDFDECTHQIISLLKSRGILAEPTSRRPDFQYSI